MAFFDSVSFHDGSGSAASIPAPTSAIERIKENNRVFIAGGGAGHRIRGAPAAKLMDQLLPGRLLELLFDLGQIEGAWRLTGRVVLHRLEELCGKGLQGHHDVGPVEEPVVINIRIVLRSLEGIAAQIEQQRHA